MSISGGDESYKWNISRLADAFGLHRDTVRKRLNDAGVQPCGKKANSPLYHLPAAAEAIFAQQVIAGDQTNPDKLDPKGRKDWYQSENERLKFQQLTKELIPTDEHRDNLASVLKLVCSFFDSLPDKMERERLFTPEQLEKLEKVSDDMRLRLYEELREVKD